MPLGELLPNQLLQATRGKNSAFTNATADKGGFGYIGLIGAPTITLTADVIEILGVQPPQEMAPSAQPAP